MAREIIEISVPIKKPRTDIMPSKTHGKAGKAKRRNDRRSVRRDIRLGRFED